MPYSYKQPCNEEAVFGLHICWCYRHSIAIVNFLGFFHKTYFIGNYAQKRKENMSVSPSATQQGHKNFFLSYQSLIYLALQGSQNNMVWSTRVTTLSQLYYTQTSPTKCQ